MLGSLTQVSDREETTMNDYIELPSGCRICPETWGWMKEAGTWRGYLDPSMYSQADRDFMAKALAV